MRKIPVFLHIPKNAGTYVLGWTMTLFRYYAEKMHLQRDKNTNRWLSLRRILLQYEGKQIATLFVYDPYKVRESNSAFVQHHTHEYCNIVELQDYLEELKNEKLTLFSVIIEDAGIQFIKENLYKDICEQNNSYPLYYTIFRDPYKRALSMYHYITSSKSAHELHTTLLNLTLLKNI